MLRALLTIFRKDDPLRAMGEDFTRMLERSHELTVEAGSVYFDEQWNKERVAQIAKRDVKINKLQRRIRKRVIAHLSVAGKAGDLPYCLLLMSLVKDVERIGDYAKELCEARELTSRPLSGEEAVLQLRDIAFHVESILKAASEVFAESDQERAIELIREGRDLLDRCNELISAVAHGERATDQQTSLVLGIQYYNRIAGHVLNILSSVVVPLHRLDYYDEKDFLVTESG